MHFPPSEHPGNEYFWHTLRVYLNTFSPAVKIILAGYVLLLILVLIRGGAKERLFYVGITVLLIPVALNPWAAWYLVEHFNFSERYFRLFWMIPVVMLYAHAGILLYQKLPKPGKAVLWVLLGGLSLLGLLTVRSKSVGLYHGTGEQKPLEIVDNIYKAEDDVVQACDIINSDSDPSTMRYVIYDSKFYIEARAYCGSIVAILVPFFTYDWKDLDTAIEEGQWRSALRSIYTGREGACALHPLNGETLRMVADRANCDYVVLEKTNPHYALWVENYPVIGITERYIVLKIHE